MRIGWVEPCSEKNFEKSSHPHRTGLTDDFFIAYPLLTEDIELKLVSGSLLAATTPIPVHLCYISNSPASAFIDHCGPTMGDASRTERPPG